MAKKSVAKSVRMTEQVYEYIQRQEGNGFNEKFESMVLYAMESEADLQQRLAFLDQQIADREKKLCERIAQYQKLNESIRSLLDSFSRSIT
ncbi:MAG: hypothetical protein Q4F24_11480 [Eubacteriales bacterium]|nr:hypothetical protein [Eubacteriales bacterium]